jgi:hypothetical protein
LEVPSDKEQDKLFKLLKETSFLRLLPSKVSRLLLAAHHK